MNETILQLWFSDFPKHPEAASSDSDYELFELDPSSSSVIEEFDDDETKEHTEVDETETIQRIVCDSDEDITTFETEDTASELEEVGTIKAENGKNISQLDDVIHRNYEVSKPSPEMNESVKLLIDKLENFLTEKLGKQMRLDIFGSLRNGFGSSDSDIDACLQFDAAVKPKKWKKELRFLQSKMDHSVFVKLCMDVVRSETKNDAKSLMPNVAAHLRASSFVSTAQAITSAKVPIVKCEILEPLRISMDICYDNTLALENTKLLAAYCQWEPDRLPQLGLWVKTWAKKSGICNSSEGYFSSYGCILLVIHYLQNCDPPVLPCLQEDFERSETLHFSGWNTYFYSEVEPDWSQNRQSVGRLFLGFLEYYANFDYRTEIVQIRRKEILTKEEKTDAEKKWIGKKVAWAIEDPFELDRNLTSNFRAPRSKRICLLFAQSNETLRKSINFVKMDGNNEDFKASLDQVLEKCTIETVKADEEKEKANRKLKRMEETAKKNKEEEEENNSSDESVHEQRKEKKPKKQKMAGSVAFCETKAQRAAFKEMEALLNAMELDKEEFPTLGSPSDPRPEKCPESFTAKKEPMKTYASTANTFSENQKSSNFDSPSKGSDSKQPSPPPKWPKIDGSLQGNTPQPTQLPKRRWETVTPQAPVIPSSSGSSLPKNDTQAIQPTPRTKRGWETVALQTPLKSSPTISSTCTVSKNNTNIQCTATPPLPATKRRWETVPQQTPLKNPPSVSSPPRWGNKNVSIQQKSPQKTPQPEQPQTRGWESVTNQPPSKYSPPELRPSQKPSYSQIQNRSSQRVQSQKKGFLQKPQQTFEENASDFPALQKP